jgi:hypothetical protein
MVHIQVVMEEMASRYRRKRRICEKPVTNIQQGVVL